MNGRARSAGYLPVGFFPWRARATHRMECQLNGANPSHTSSRNSLTSYHRDAIRSANVGLLWGCRLRRQPNISPTLAERILKCFLSDQPPVRLENLHCNLINTMATYFNAFLCWMKERDEITPIHWFNLTRPPLTWSLIVTLRGEKQRSAGFEPGTDAWLTRQSGPLPMRNVPLPFMQDVKWSFL